MKKAGNHTAPLPRFIRSLRDALNLNQVEFGERYRVTQAQVSQWETGKHDPTSKTLLEMMTDARIVGLKGPTQFDEIAAAAGIEFAGLAPDTVRCIGSVEAGIWRPVSEAPEKQLVDPDDEHPNIALPIDISPYPLEKCFALTVRGSSMNRVYPDGTIIYCIKYYDIAALGKNPEAGDRAVILRRRHGEIECSVKQLAVGKDGGLVAEPRSTDPAHQKPLDTSSDVVDGDEVEIWALVVTAIVPQTPLFSTIRR